MRAQIVVDSATTSQVRRLAVALHKVGLTGQLSVGVNGPDLWQASTPKLTELQFDQVRAAMAGEC